MLAQPRGRAMWPAPVAAACALPLWWVRGASPAPGELLGHPPQPWAPHCAPTLAERCPSCHSSAACGKWGISSEVAVMRKPNTALALAGLNIPNMTTDKPSAPLAPVQHRVARQEHCISDLLSLNILFSSSQLLKYRGTAKLT